MSGPSEVFISRAAIEQECGLTRKQLIQMIVNSCGRAAPVIAFYNGHEPWEANEPSTEGK